MTFDAKDRAILSASSLVGYCQSALSLHIDCAGVEEAERLTRWIEGLIDYAEKTQSLIDEALQ